MYSLKFVFHEKQRVLVATVSGTLGTRGLPEFVDHIFSRFEVTEARGVVLAGLNVSRVSESGLAVLVSLQEKLLCAGGCLRLSARPGGVYYRSLVGHRRNLLWGYIYASDEAALEAFGKSTIR